ncbi:MAG: hypothetical protein ACOH12_16685 [Parvibaculaceae bacterium]
MRFRVLAFTVLLPLLSACTHTDVAVVDAAQAQMTPTVASYQAMAFTPVANPSTQYGPVGAGDPVYDFGYYGRSYYKAIELPRAATDYVLEVTSGMFVPAGKSQFHMFFPNFVFLDANRKPVPVVANQAPFFDFGEDDNFKRTIRFVIKPDTKARYVVIYASRDMIVNGEEVSYGSGGMVYVGGLFIPTGGPRFLIKGSQDGTIGITIKEPAPAKVK